MTLTAKPSDFTGRQRQVEAQKAAEQIREREGQIAMSQQIELDRLDSDVWDPSTNESLGHAEAIVLDEAKREVVIKVIEDIEDMTFGAGTHYTFKAGQKYKVSEDIADHLESIGYLLGRM